MPAKCCTADLHSQFLVLWNTISFASPGWPWTWGPPSSVPPITKCLGHRCVSSCLPFSSTPLCGLKTLQCPSYKWYLVHLNLPPAYEINIFSDILKWFCFKWTGIAQGGQGGPGFWSCRRWIVATEAVTAAFKSHISLACLLGFCFPGREINYPKSSETQCYRALQL